MTPGQAIKAACLECLGANTGGTAFDCQSNMCALYPAHPYRGKRRDDTTVLTDPAKCAARQRPTRGIIAAMCRQCQPETTAHCTSHTCPLLPFTPFQPGGRPKRPISEGQKARLASISPFVSGPQSGGQFATNYATAGTTAGERTSTAPEGRVRDKVEVSR